MKKNKISDLDNLVKFVSKTSRLIKYFEREGFEKDSKIFELVQRAKKNDIEAIFNLQAIRISNLLNSLRKKQMNFF
jgi:hypothetical protein